MFFHGICVSFEVPLFVLVFPPDICFECCMLFQSTFLNVWDRVYFWCDFSFFYEFSSVCFLIISIGVFLVKVVISIGVFMVNVVIIGK